MQFSVVTSVYKNDKPEDVVQALESITSKQTVKPDEVVLVVDGPVGNDLSNVVKRFEMQPEFHVIWLQENGGLGNALKLGVSAAKYDVIARMDSDDISVANRFEMQTAFLSSNHNVSIVGGQISEFIGSPSTVVGQRIVPTSDADLQAYLKSRCPFNHVTVMFRKADVLQVGNYLDWYCNEDYYLWIRMAEAGLKFANLPETLVNVRVGKEMYQRRGGWKYFKSEANLQGYMFKHGIISFPRYCFNVAVRFGVQVAMPNKLRGFIFQKLFRNQKTDNK
jgi:glycosyltransferase involved in cell wall biosynthesis